MNLITKIVKDSRHTICKTMYKADGINVTFYVILVLYSFMLPALNSNTFDANSLDRFSKCLFKAGSFIDA